MPRIARVMVINDDVSLGIEQRTSAFDPDNGTVILYLFSEFVSDIGIA